MGIRELVTVIEGKDWIIRTSGQQNLIARNYIELNKLNEEYKNSENVPKQMANYFFYTNSDAYNNYIAKARIRNDIEFEEKLNDICLTMIITVGTLLIIYSLYYSNLMYHTYNNLTLMA